VIKPFAVHWLRSAGRCWGSDSSTEDRSWSDGLPAWYCCNSST